MGFRYAVKRLRPSIQACPSPRTSLSARNLTHQRHREELRVELKHAPFVAPENQREDLEAQTSRMQFFVIYSQRKAGKQPRLHFFREIQEGGGSVTLWDSDEDSQSEEEDELAGDLCNFHLNSPAPASYPVPQGKLRHRVPNMATTKFSLLQWGHRATQVVGEDISWFKLFPIFEQLDQQNQNVRVNAAIPFKTLKELKFACSTYGSNSPFVQSLTESVCNKALKPYDWIILAKACLSGGDYLLWKPSWMDFCSEQAETNRMQGVQITLEMLTGTGQFADLE